MQPQGQAWIPCTRTVSGASTDTQEPLRRAGWEPEGGGIAAHGAGEGTGRIGVVGQVRTIKGTRLTSRLGYNSRNLAVIWLARGCLGTLEPLGYRRETGGLLGGGYLARCLPR